VFLHDILVIHTSIVVYFFAKLDDVGRIEHLVVETLVTCFSDAFKPIGFVLRVGVGRVLVEGRHSLLGVRIL